MQNYCLQSGIWFCLAHFRHDITEAPPQADPVQIKASACNSRLTALKLYCCFCVSDPHTNIILRTNINKQNRPFLMLTSISCHKLQRCTMTHHSFPWQSLKFLLGQAVSQSLSLSLFVDSCSKCVLKLPQDQCMLLRQLNTCVFLHRFF